MTSVRFIRRENPLAKMIQSPGGVRVSEALEQASANLDSIREKTIAEVDSDLSVIEQLLAQAVERPATDTLKQAYRCCNTVAGMAGSCGLGGVGQAAFSLCELLDRLIHGGGWSHQGVLVHLNAMKLLRTDVGAAAEGPVLAGLRKVTVAATQDKKS